jgi:hypothetical protein
MHCNAKKIPQLVILLITCRHFYYCYNIMTVRIPLSNPLFHWHKSNTTYLSSASWQLNAPVYTFDSKTCQMLITLNLPT